MTDRPTLTQPIVSTDSVLSDLRSLSSTLQALSLKLRVVDLTEQVRSALLREVDSMQWFAVFAESHFATRKLLEDAHEEVAQLKRLLNSYTETPISEVSDLPETEPRIPSRESLPEESLMRLIGRRTDF